MKMLGSKCWFERPDTVVISRIVSALLLGFCVPLFLQAQVNNEPKDSARPNDREWAVFYEALQDPSAKIRKKAILYQFDHYNLAYEDTAELMFVGPRDPELASLILDRCAELAQDGQPDAALILCQLASNPAFATKHLDQIIVLLTDQDARRKIVAVKTLGSLASSTLLTADHVNKLASLLTDEGVSVPRTVASALGNLATSKLLTTDHISRIVLMVAHQSATERYDAMEAVAKCSSNPSFSARHLDQISEMLTNQNWQIRRAALSTLAGCSSSPFFTTEHVNKVIALLTDNERDMQMAAAMALRKLATSPLLTIDHVSKINALFKDPEPEIRFTAARALSNLVRCPFFTAEHLNQIIAVLSDLALLTDKDPEIRLVVVDYLDELGDLVRSPFFTAEHLNQIIALLTDPNKAIQLSVANELDDLVRSPLLTTDHITKICALLTDQSKDVKRAATRALNNLVNSPIVTADHVNRIIDLLTDEQYEVSSNAAEALSGIATSPSFTTEHISKIIALFTNQSEDVSGTAADLLSNVVTSPSLTADHVSKITALLSVQDRTMKSAAAIALAKISTSPLLTSEHINLIFAHLAEPELIERSFSRFETLDKLATSPYLKIEHLNHIAAMLRHTDWRVRADGLHILGKLASSPVFSNQHLIEISSLLNDSDEPVRSIAVDVLHECASTARCLNRSNWVDLFSSLTDTAIRNELESAQIAWCAYHLLGDNPDASWLLRQLLSQSERLSSPIYGSYDSEAVHRLLNLIPNKKYSSLEDRAATLVGGFVQSGVLGVKDLELVKTAHIALQGAGRISETAAVGNVYKRLQALNQLGLWGRRVSAIIFIHAGCWFLLILVYPHREMVQGWFWWNPTLRKFTGLGYVTAVLAAVPCLRKRLFSPFRNRLVLPEEREGVSPDSYYDGSEVVVRPSREIGDDGGRRRMLELFQPLRGQWVLQGASGLGKSMLVRHLCMIGENIPVLLYATECSEGVVKAIQSRLEGIAADDPFLRTLIHAGAVDVFIDGLNEAAPETRFRIARDMEQNFKGNFLLTTQPLGRWKPPGTARVADLQPLIESEVGVFLKKQWKALSVGVKPRCVDRIIYEREVDNLLDDLVKRRVNDADASQQLEMLQVPLDAVLAAELIAEGQRPTPRILLEQHQARMEHKFNAQYDRSFPVEQFANRILEWRLSETPYVDVVGFEDEATCLVACKLMRLVEEKIVSNKAEHIERRWTFRHDRIMEHFLYPAFVNSGRIRRWDEKCWGDQRFWGVYRLLSQRLPWPEARDLQRFLTKQCMESGEIRLLQLVTAILSLREQSEPEHPEAKEPSQFMKQPANLNDPKTDGLSLLTKDLKNYELDVVFVHGLSGDARTTWQSEGEDTFWPEWLGRDFPQIRVWSLGYNATLSAWTKDSMPLADRGLNVLDQLYNDDLGTEKPLVFITHSMGGLVVKQVLQQAETMGVPRYEAIARRTVGIAFLATPHSGANLANFATFVGTVLRANDHVQDLELHSAELQKLHGWFLHYVTRQKLVCRTWCERFEVRGVIPFLGVTFPKGIIVVNATSAEPNIQNERAIPLDENHITISKPSSDQHIMYKGMKKFMLECLARAQQQGRPIPKVAVQCATDVEGCVSPSVGGGLAFRILVSNDGVGIEKCRGYLRKIRCGDHSIWGGGNEVTLTFQPSEGPEWNSKTIPNRGRVWLDVIFVVPYLHDNDWYIRPGTKDHLWPIDDPMFHELFKELGDYILTVAIAAPSIETIERDYLFRWAGTPSNSSLSLLPEIPC